MCQVGSHQQRERERERHAPRVSTNEMPSIQASRHPPMTAEIADALSPPRAARMPPVAAPEMMAFQGSCVARPVSDASGRDTMSTDPHAATRTSFLRICTSEQSMAEKSPAQMAKLPPV
mgnify:FL=1